MTCVICKHGETRPGAVTVSLERDGETFVIRGVPADVCSNCGEEYLNEATTDRLLHSSGSLHGTGVRVEIRDFAAA